MCIRSKSLISNQNLIFLAGACLEWRIAVILYAVVPICCFIMVFMSPESPYWLICKDRSEDALKSLTILRGKSNIDLSAVHACPFILISSRCNPNFFLILSRFLETHFILILSRFYPIF